MSFPICLTVCLSICLAVNVCVPQSLRLLSLPHLLALFSSMDLLQLPTLWVDSVARDFSCRQHRLLLFFTLPINVQLHCHQISPATLFIICSRGCRSFNALPYYKSSHSHRILSPPCTNYLHPRQLLQFILNWYVLFAECHRNTLQERQKKQCFR